VFQVLASNKIIAKNERNGFSYACSFENSFNLQCFNLKHIDLLSKCPNNLVINAYSLLINQLLIVISIYERSQNRILTKTISFPLFLKLTVFIVLDVMMAHECLCLSKKSFQNLLTCRRNVFFTFFYTVNLKK